MTRTPAEHPGAGRRPRLVYIGGYGRSGSTLLEWVLSGAPGVLSAGELTHLFREAAVPSACTCGQSIPDCPVWGDALATVDATGPSALAELDALTRRVEAGRGDDADCRHHAQIWRAVLIRALDRAGAGTVIDSSKSTFGYQRRPQGLRRAGFDVTPVLVVRDPRAVGHSVGRGSNRALARGDVPSGPRVPIVQLANWAWSNLAVEADARRHGGRLLLRYEDLVRDPTARLEGLALSLGLPPEPVLRVASGEEAPPVGHGVLGNRMRRRPFTGIGEDREWRRSRRGPVTLAALPVWPLARAYGYRWGA